MLPDPPVRVILAIDPGPTQSALCVFNGMSVHTRTLPNAKLRELLPFIPADLLVVEMIASYGMPVGCEVFETCVWIGRFLERWGGRCERLTRKEAVMHLCHSPRGNDASIRRALMDRFGGDASVRKAKRCDRKRHNGACCDGNGLARPAGLLAEVTGDGWAALAVAVTAWDQRRGGAHGTER